MKKYQKELQNAKPFNSTHKKSMSLYMAGDLKKSMFTVFGPDYKDKVLAC